MVTNEATVMTVISTTDITTSDSTRLKPGRRRRGSVSVSGATPGILRAV